MQTKTMAPKENSIPTEIVILWELLLFQLLALQLTSASVPTNALRPRCRERCGDVEIPYPFGIGRNCSMEGFTLNCTFSNGTYKPFLNNIEFLSISLSSGIARIANEVSSQCYNAMYNNVTYDDWYMNLTATPYRFSSTLNKFTTIGCMTLAYLILDDTVNSYWSGCASMCRSRENLSNGLCTSIGCCQTAIPKGIGYCEVYFDPYFNSSTTYNFSRCGYAVLVEESTFEFDTSYITTGELYRRKLPMVVDWAVRNKTCREAQQNMTSYACVSEHSRCVDSANGPGYLCNCSDGYQGNPYLSHGCQDIDECANNVSRCSGGICHNTQGGYECSCRSGSHGDAYNGTCQSNQKLSLSVKLVLVLGICIGDFLKLTLWNFDFCKMTSAKINLQI